MADVLTRAGEACAPDPLLFPDLVWMPEEGIADLRLADPDETLNPGGLRAKAMLSTAVTICLFTDKRCPVDHPLAYLVDDGDMRGWWGDAPALRDASEPELGSLLWLFRRAPLTVRGQPIERWVEAETFAALAILKDQGAVARIEASALANRAANRLDLTVRLYGRDGANVYDQQFEVVWGQVTALPSGTRPLPPPAPSFDSGTYTFDDTRDTMDRL